MSTTATAITADHLAARLGTPFAPQLFDVCRPEAYAESTRVIAGAR